jgi:hypothetical protein
VLAIILFCLIGGAAEISYFKLNILCAMRRMTDVLTFIPQDNAVPEDYTC